LALVFSTPLLAQVVINEVCSANGSVVADFENDYEDWIELYNPGPNAVNLKDYYFETFETSQKRWTFPNVVLKPDSCFIIFCSKKDRTAVIDHFELPVHPWLSWHYKVGTSEPDPDWVNPSFNDASWAQGFGPIGYGDGDDVTTITPTPVTSIFMRDTFVLTQPENVLTGFLLMDYDDAFVAYINGVEVGRNNIWTPGRPPYNAFASEEHEARMYSCPNQNDQLSCAEFFFIEPEVLQDALVVGVNSFAVQVHNFDQGMDDMTGLSILLFGIQGADTTFISFPNVDNLHTNFNLSSEGQRLSLKDPSGNIVDEYIVDDMQVDHSRGRFPDGSSNWCLMQSPTPCAPNVGSCYSGYGKSPAFTVPAGFYPGTIQVGIVSDPPGEIVYYTTDGSTPDPSDNFYSGPITISKTTVVRALQYPLGAGTLPGRASTGTYLINDRPSLPVVSLTTDSVNLFDTITGIYMLGPNVDTTVDDFPYWGIANYYQDWSRPAHVEYFDKNGVQQLNQDCEVKIHGNFSRGWPQKSFRFFANDKHGKSWFDFQPFPKKPGIDKFKSFNVRNGGVDYNTTHFRDALMQQAARNTHVDIMDNQPIVLFLNGKYWGVYGLRERQDEKYIQQNYGIDGDFVDLLRFNGDAMNGSSKGYEDMVEFISDNDIAVSTNYDSAQTLLDIENFCDYIIAETYFVNGDWISPDGGTNNIKFWRNTAPVSKWRYILWDTDLGLNLVPPWQPGEDYEFDYLGQLLQPNYTDPHSIMLQNLLDNQDFKYYFINRFADLVNTEYSAQTFTNVAQNIYAAYLPEMNRHFSLWGAPPKTIWNIFTLGRSSNVAEWNLEFANVLNFIAQRPFFARNNMETLFNLNGQVDVTLNTIPEGAGKIKISTITPDTYPWTGVYFDGVPVTMSIIPNPGFVFRYWQSDVFKSTPDSNERITLNISANDAFTAHFEAIEVSINASPNPFTNAITLTYQLLDEAQVSMKLYDHMGKLVAVLADFGTFQSAGEHKFNLNPEKYNLAAGVYMLEFSTGDFKTITKIVRL